MNRSIKLGLSLTALFAATACSTMNVQKDKIASVKKAAIVGFDMVQEMPPTTTFEIGGGSDDKDIPAMAKLQPKLAKAEPHAMKVHDRFAQSLAKKFGWTMIPRQNVQNEKTYAQIFKRETTGWHGRPMMDENHEIYSADGVLDTYSFNKLKPEERKAIMKALGVDALIVAQLNVKLEKAGGFKKLIGAGEFRPKSSASITVWDATGEEPIWRDAMAEGDATYEGVNHFLGVTSQDKLNEAVVASSESAVKMLLHRYEHPN